MTEREKREDGERATLLACARARFVLFSAKVRVDSSVREGEGGGVGEGTRYSLALVLAFLASSPRVPFQKNDNVRFLTYSKVYGYTNYATCRYMVDMQQAQQWQAAQQAHPQQMYYQQQVGVPPSFSFLRNALEMS